MLNQILFNCMIYIKNPEIEAAQTAIGGVVANLIASENTGSLATYKFDTSAFSSTYGGKLTHTKFSPFNTATIVGYLVNRPK